MAIRVRSFSKVNLGLTIGPVQGDGFHELTTVYQTLALYDVVTVSARRAAATEIVLTTNHPRVPVDGRNTAWKMVARCLERLGVAAEVAIHLEKGLPVQGGLGAGSANAAATLLGLERELGVALGEAERLEVAAEVGSDVPLFLIGGAVLGVGRGEVVSPMEELPAMPCVVAVPEVGVSTPQAFRAWDSKVGNTLLEDEGRLTRGTEPDTLMKLSLAYSSLLAKVNDEKLGTTGTASSALSPSCLDDDLERQQGQPGSDRVGRVNDLAGSTPLALVRTGIGSTSSSLENDFETVVFPQYPSLGELKLQLMGSGSGGPALYAALSGSGSALFGLYRSFEDARAAQHRVQAAGAKALLTATLPRADYWRTMFAG